MTESKRPQGLQTQLVHAGEHDYNGAVTTPIFQSATYREEPGTTRYADVRYVRLNNTPNHDVLCQKLATICEGSSAMVMSSGMAAISNTFMALLRHGDHILAQDCLYGGTRGFLTREAERMGIEVSFIDGRWPESWSQHLRPNTRMIYVEAMTNPLVQVADLAQVVTFSYNHGLLSVIDNTFASPVNFKPLKLGFDVEIHSATKYLGGHSDVVAGAVIGQRRFIDDITRTLNHTGGCLDPHACFLLQRGMKTLGLRVKAQNAGAMAIAKTLLNHSAVAQVHYAGLPSHPDHAIASDLFKGFGGVLSFELHGGKPHAMALIEALTLPTLAPSLGGVETLITLPATSSHAGVPADERLKMGITDGLVRVAVGIEDPEDLCHDFRQALDSLLPKEEEQA